jgi:hypothetical protein
MVGIMKKHRRTHRAWPMWHAPEQQPESSSANDSKAQSDKPKLSVFEFLMKASTPRVKAKEKP